MRRALLQLCSSLLVSAVAVLSQAPANSSSNAAPTTTITTSTRLVVVDAVVTDRTGNPVHGLKASDFTVLEDGKPQAIHGFEEHSPEKPSAAVVRPNLPPNTYTNYVSSEEPGAANILLFDSLNTDRTGLSMARQQLLSYLTRMPASSRVALFTLDGQLHLVHGFTDDTQALIAAAQKLATTPNSTMRKAREVSGELADVRSVHVQNNPAMYSALSRFLWTEYDDKAVSRTVMTMEALNQLARSMAIFPGRKNLIWISGGIPFDPTETTPEMRRTAALLNATQMAVYPVDVRGIPWMGADGAAPSADVFGPRGGDYETRSGQGLELSQVRETMQQMAALTGGRAYFNNNDIPGEIHDVVQTGSSYYVLAYRPQNQNWDGNFRKITVRPGLAGLKVQCRPGYYAVKEPFGSTNIDHSFSVAMQPGVPPSTALVIQARVLPPDAAGQATQVDFLLDVHDLSFLHASDGRQKPDLMFVAAAWSKEGKAQGSVSGTYQQVLDPAAVKNLARTGLRLQERLALNPGSYDLRLGVVDRLSGKIGTIDVPLTIEAKVAHEK